MATQESQSVLRRKADAGTQEHQARAMTVAKAMRLGVARVADSLMDLPLSAIGIVVERRAAQDCAELLLDSALLMLLDAPRRGAGAAILSADLAGGLIQQQTMGTVRPASGDARAMTNTDAALAAPLIDALLERTARQVEAPDDRAVLEGVRYGARAEEPRMVQMALDGADYIVVRLTLDMAKGARQGELTLILPPPQPPGVAGPEDEDAEPGTGEASAGPGGPDRKAFTDLVFGLRAQLHIELCTLDMPLSAASKLAVGDVLDLPPGTFPTARIIAADGRYVGTGTIGQVDGVRALRLDPKPIYASAPRRRATDQDDLDLPDVQPLEDGRAAEDVPAALPDLPDLPELPSPSGAPDLPGSPDIGVHDDAPSGPVDIDLPELDDLPDLTDLPDLPDIDDLPDLAELKEA